jgi:glycosyltransferase involved in cell wall biosynthesis
MDIFTLPSFGEGFGLVLLEAMACSKPVVATDVMSIPEIVENGETGFLVPVQDSSALAKALDTLIETPELRDKFGKAGFRRVQEEFTIEGMVGKTIKKYKEATQISRGKRKSSSSVVRNPALSPEQRTKIVRIIARLNIGGPSLHVVNLNQGLSSDRFESLLLTGTTNPGEGSMSDYAQSHGVQPLAIPEMFGEASFRLRDLKALLKLYRILRVERPQIVHTHTAKAGFLGRLAARMAGVPVIVHTYHGHVLNGYYGPAKSWLLRMIERGLARITDRLVAVSDLVKEDLIAYRVAPPDKISVIPLGFDLEPFLDCGSLKGEFRRELGLGPGDKLVGILGRIFPIKNHRLFLKSAAQISQQESSVHFVVVGDGILRSEMERYAQDLGIRQRVFFTGWRRNLPRIYADLDLLVVSSNNEGTPVSAIEAMASGCPVVATRVGGLPDIIKDGKTGYLVPAKQPQSLATAILELIRDPQRARQMGRSAQLSVMENFSLDRLLRDTEHLYEELLTSKRVS